ncbi:hypothetical protein V6R98_17435 [Agrobacterium sp. CCNWLW71]|uniref:hypothetical protein n=1 Tax=unclassified Agrobacterium TaxID=2632611 RepID=UPI002FF3125F
MKLNHYMRYPHPVLSDYSEDYVSGEFSCKFEQNITASGELRLVSSLQIANDLLTDLIKTQAASAGYFLVCRRTYFNHLQVAPLGESEKYFDAARLFGSVIIRPVVWTIREIAGLASPLIHPEFGESVPVAKGAVIALGPEFRFSMDQKKYKPFDSIFELARNEDVAENTVSVDHDQDRITILARDKTYKEIAAIRDINRGKDMILNTIYLPAIMEVIFRLQAGETDVEGRKWYRIFKARCVDLGKDPSDPSISPLELAQQLLRGPLRKTISLMESVQ